MSLRPSIMYGDLDLTAAPYLWEFGGDLGGPELVSTALAQQLQDGEIVTSDRNSNRTLTLTILVESTDMLAAARAESALVLECNKAQNVLIYNPGDGYGPASAFDTFAASMAFLRDDREEQAGIRRWQLTIPALPFPRSLNPVTASLPTPIGATPTVTSVDTCTTTTGWTGTSGASIGTFLGRVAVYGTYTGAKTLWALRTGLSATSSGVPYVRIATGPMDGATGPVSIYLNGSTTPSTPVAQSGGVFWFDMTGVTLTSVKVSQAFYRSGASRTYSLRVADIARTNTTSDSSTTRQQSGSIEVRGSVRVPATISVSDPAATTALGTVMVYTSSNPNQAQPNLRQYLVGTAASSATPDSTVISGARSGLVDVHEFDIPIDGLPADGSTGYSFIARIRSLSTGTFTLSWSAGSLVGSTSTTDDSGTLDVTLTANVWTTVHIALLTLPTRAVGSSGFGTVTLSGPSAVAMDEAWLFNLTAGQLTWIECGTDAVGAGAGSNYVWLDAASVSRPVCSVWRSSDAIRSDQMYAGPETHSMMAHSVTPPALQVFAVTSESLMAQVSLTYLPGAHTHVTE